LAASASSKPASLPQAPSLMSSSSGRSARTSDLSRGPRNREGLKQGPSFAHVVWLRCSRLL
jgi:hypothetical protein